MSDTTGSIQPAPDTRRVVAERAHHLRPPIEICDDQRSNRPRRGSRDERGEVGLQPLRLHLEQPLGVRDVLQVMLAEIAERKTGQALVFDDAGGRMRQDDLSAMRGRADACGTADADADIAVAVQVRLCRV